MYGKEEINEKMVAKATNAKEILKKSRKDHFNIFEDSDGLHDMRIFDLL